MLVIKNKWVFLHTPKTGGSSIRNLFNTVFTDTYVVGGWHMGLTEAIRVYPEANIQGYNHVVTVIRNPVHRLISLYVQDAERYTNDNIPHCIRCRQPRVECTDVSHRIPPDPVHYFNTLSDIVVHAPLRMPTHDGKLPTHLKLLRFDTLNEDITNWCRTEFGQGVTLPHYNRKQPGSTQLYTELLACPSVIDIIHRRTRDEREFFNWDL